MHRSRHDEDAREGAWASAADAEDGKHGDMLDRLSAKLARYDKEAGLLAALMRRTVRKG
jgi:hypothetical protein